MWRLLSGVGRGKSPRVMIMSQVIAPSSCVSLVFFALLLSLWRARLLKDTSTFHVPVMKTRRRHVVVVVIMEGDQETKGPTGLLLFATGAGSQ